MFFSLIAQFLMLNLFVMVIVEGYEVIDDDCRSKTEDDITPFQYHWSEFDPDATGYITVEQLPGLVKLLPPPLGCGGEDNPKLVQLIVKRVVEIPGYDYSFEETLVHLMTSRIIFHAKRETDMSQMLGVKDLIAKVTIQRWLVREIRHWRYVELEKTRRKEADNALISHEAEKDRHARAAADTTEHKAGEQVVEGEEQTMAATEALTPSQKSKARTRRPLSKAPPRPHTPMPIQPDAPATADAAADSPTEPTSDPRNVADATAEPAVNAATDGQPDAATEPATDGGDGEEPYEDASLLQVETAPKVNAGTIVL